MIAVNTISLAVRPGLEILQELGGIHRFSGWDGPIVSDSGVHELLDLANDAVDLPAPPPRRAPGQPARLLKVDGEGISFTSYVDGSGMRITPEESIRSQVVIGTDLATTFASAIPVTGRRPAPSPTERWLSWVERSVAARDVQTGLLGVVEPGHLIHDPAALARVIELPLDGFMLNLSGSGADTEILGQLPDHRVRYARAVPDLAGVRRALLLGCDLLACEFPVRDARRGQVYAANGPLDLWDRSHAERFEPVDALCACLACRSFTRAYLHHLFAAEELLGYRLAALHNLTWLTRMVQGVPEDAAGPG
jgi:queuine tRNA-ribosyltransferase